MFVGWVGVEQVSYHSVWAVHGHDMFAYVCIFIIAHILSADLLLEESPKWHLLSMVLDEIRKDNKSSAQGMYSLMKKT